MTIDANVNDRQIRRRAPAKDTIQAIAATLSAIAIIAFQSAFLPFFQPLFASDRLVWPTVYYGYWFLTLSTALIIFFRDPTVRRQSLPVVLVCALTVASAFLHPLDWVSKNLIVAMLLLTCVTVLTLGSASLFPFRLSASVTALNAVVCLLDILFADGFTNTVGRAAGLAINPNDAATGLLLGAAATYWAVPRRWQIAFLLLAVAAIFVTLSRSALLAAIIIGSGIAAISLVRMIRNGSRPRFDSRQFVRIGLSVFFLTIWIVTALFTNDRFEVAATDAFSGLHGALSAIEDASAPVRTAVQRLAAQSKPPTAVGGAETEAQLNAFEAARIDAQVDAIGKVSENEGEKNSVSARALLMWRAYIMYKSGPFFGRGLAAAHELLPHNTFLMFAVAFGHLGWLVALALVALTFYRVRDANQLPLGLATAAVLMTSHDILFPSLIVPIAVGIAGNISDRTAAKACLFGSPRRVVVAASIFFIIGCGVIVARFEGYRTTRLGNGIKEIQSSKTVFAARIPRPEFSGVLRVAEVASQNSAGQNLFLVEDGKVLSDVQAPDAAVMRGGQYFVWRRNTLLFSTSDNSDPRFNGRSYEIRTAVSIHPLIFLVIGAILIWCAVVVTKLGRPQSIER
jgi:hypothetical protein